MDHKNLPSRSEFSFRRVFCTWSRICHTYVALSFFWGSDFLFASTCDSIQLYLEDYFDIVEKLCNRHAIRGGNKA